LSTIGGITISVSGFLTLLFYVGTYNEWEQSIIKSVVDENEDE
jgi:hypothetical protein